MALPQETLLPPYRSRTTTIRFITYLLKPGAKSGGEVPQVMKLQRRGACENQTLYIIIVNRADQHCNSLAIPSDDNHFRGE